MGITYSEGVSKRGMSLQRFVDVTSANCARIMGLYPRKGALAPGSDADITLIDPSIKKRLTMDDFHISDYSIWEGFEIEGWPVMTIMRGPGGCGGRPAYRAGWQGRVDPAQD